MWRSCAGVSAGGGGREGEAHVFGFVGEVEEVADYDVDEDAEVVAVKVFVGCGGGEEEVEEL